MKLITVCYLISFALGQIPDIGKGKCYQANRPKPSPPTYSGDAAGCLAAHNNARSAKGLPPLTWDSNLASAAQGWSSKLAGMGVLQHSGSGENLYSGGGGCGAAVNAWMGEGKNYHGQAVDYGDLMSIGHYTQVMWKGSRSVGCGDVGGYVTCRYSPAGNMVGQTPY